MNWNDSLKFVESLDKKDRKRYSELLTQYSNASMDGHEAHLCAAEKLYQEMEKNNEREKSEVVS